mgnify:CR=1 FL=1
MPAAAQFHMLYLGAFTYESKNVFASLNSFSSSQASLIILDRQSNIGRDKHACNDWMSLFAIPKTKSWESA